MQGYEYSKACFELPLGWATTWHTQFLRTLNFETLVNFQPKWQQWIKFFHSCNDKIFLLFISFEKTSSFSTWSKTPILDVCNVKNFHVIVMWGKSQKRTWNFYRKWISHPLSMKSSRQRYHNRLKMCKILHKFDHINFFCNENQSYPIL